MGEFIIALVITLDGSPVEFVPVSIYDAYNSIRAAIGRVSGAYAIHSIDASVLAPCIDKELPGHPEASRIVEIPAEILTPVGQDGPPNVRLYICKGRTYT